MNLNENILRVKELMGILNESDEGTKLYHLSRYTNRNSIMKNGLTPQVGQKTKNLMSNVPSVKQNENYVYLLVNPNNIDRVKFGFDTWLVDDSNLDLNLINDPNHPDEKRYFVTKQSIPPEALTLISSDEATDDYYLNIEKHGFPERKKVEPEKEKPEEKYFDISQIDPNLTMDIDFD